MNYDLEKRTLDFSKAIIRLVKILKQNEINKNLVSQLIRGATSVGANYREANGASSKKDFQNKIHICLKKSKKLSIG